MMDTIAILDFGSQYTQLIARRVRELHVYCEIFPWDSSPDKLQAMQPKGFILSGGPSSVYQPGAPTLPAFVLDSRMPVLGICYGMQALTQALGGKVAASRQPEYGSTQIEVLRPNPLLPPGKQMVWMSHADRIETPPPGFEVIARSQNSPIAAFGHTEQKYYGLQFHPEVGHTPGGQEVLLRFVVDICQAKQEWTPQAMIQTSIAQIRNRVSNEHALVGVSGGVDSSVAAALVQRAIGDRLCAVFVDNGLLRMGEREQVEQTFRTHLGMQLTVVNAVEQFMDALQGISDPETKRKVIGETFIQVFEAQARKLGTPRFLVQGTIYPDVVESSASPTSKGARIKSHHNVAGLPCEISFDLLEPLRNLYKDEVRNLGLALGLPDELVWRQPFPGPGLAVRCLGCVSMQRLDILRAADAIFLEELTRAGLLNFATDSNHPQPVSQAFAILLPVHSVGVMGDQRTYQEVVALRAITTQDFMTADWVRLPSDLLARISNRIVNEVKGINRVVYDITSKPPATIEWE